ncbi:MAG: DUF3501 family protein [Alphaproteobacteria bacterium]|nr:DUF3501 family protein [Alphaproteobacteria bacterium]
MAQKHAITRADIVPLDKYTAERRSLRQNVIAVKQRRRLEVGPFATFSFENYQTMWHQVHEMLYIEKGGEEQIAGELAAYNPLIPQGRELVATVMFEIDEPVRRDAALRKLGGIEANIFLSVGGDLVRAVAETDVERTKADGKTSSVHFVHFPFTDTQVTAFRKPGAQVIVGFDHPEYSHMTVMPEAVRQALGEDFD